MRLLYIHQYFAFPDINSSTRSYDLATYFVKNGIEVLIITTTTKIKGLTEKNRWNYLERDGIALWVLSSNYNQKMNPFERVKVFLVFMFFASIKALQIKCDLVLATSSPLTVAVPALLKRLLSGTPFIFEVRDIWLETLIKVGFLRNRFLIWLLTSFEKLVYRRAYCIVPLSVDMEKSVLAVINNAKTVVIPNISEVNRFQSEIRPFDLGLNIDPKDKKTIIYAGAIARGNGIKYVADLAVIFNKLNPDVVFLIIGVGNEKEMIINYCENSGILNKSIFFPAPVPKSYLPYLYSCCTMGSSFVIDNPVLWANSANKFFDTLASGKPVLINYGGWQADLIKQENLGYILPPEISLQSVESFNNYLNNKTLLAQQSENALAVAKRYYSLDVAANKYLDIFHRFIKEIKK